VEKPPPEQDSKASKDKGLSEGDAQQATATSQWSEAGDIYRALAQRTNDPVRSEQWRIQAGDAFRRADRPAAVVQVLEGLSKRRNGRALVLLSGALLDCGAVGAALAAADDAMLQTTSHSQLQMVALDTACGVRLAAGDIEGAHHLRDLLLKDASAASQMAAAFRTATLQRLAGQLAPAQNTLETILQAIAAIPAARGAVASAQTELGELHLAAGAPQAARNHFHHGLELWAEDLRRGGAFVCEAGLLRADLAEGLTPLASRLDRAVEYAQERDLVLLEAAIRAARTCAWNRSGVYQDKIFPEFERLVDRCMRLGAMQLEGRCRFLAWRLSTPPTPPDARTRITLQNDKLRSDALDHGPPDNALW
jgi:hypothetical protein